jgi:hypothetical protein
MHLSMVSSHPLSLHNLAHWTHRSFQDKSTFEINCSATPDEWLALCSDNSEFCLQLAEEITTLIVKAKGTNCPNIEALVPHTLSLLFLSLSLFREHAQDRRRRHGEHWQEKLSLFQPAAVLLEESYAFLCRASFAIFFFFSLSFFPLRTDWPFLTSLLNRLPLSVNTTTFEE